MQTIDTDFFVVGSGIAGLMSALNLARLGKVLIATKKQQADSNTNRAQGGIACVMNQDDSFDAHVNDTLIAGAGLCNEEVVRQIVSAGPERIAELRQLGVAFTERDDGAGLDLGREGGHSSRRVLHVGDFTGQNVEAALLARANAHPNIRIAEHWMLIDLITTSWLQGLRHDPPGSPAPTPDNPSDNRCVGAYVLDRISGEILAVRAPYLALATGGGGKVYLYTSNPDIATGDGIAVAWRSGVHVRNMEFIQFHPTCLYHPDAKSFLISEAVRGEGGILVDAAGKAFMPQYDPRADLAPRDIVARAIDSEMKHTGAPCVYIDIRHRSQRYLKDRFPNIYRTLREFGIDMAQNLIPVVPAAHYFCGGLEAGVDGTTCLPGLFACGEVACTGLHGANRLASNSLLEALVCAHQMAETISQLPPPASFPKPNIPDWECGDAVPSDEAVVVEHNWNEIRTCMWDYVGIVRTDKRLERAWRRIRNLRHEIRQYYHDYLVTSDTLELRNIAGVAELIVRCAQLRKESRGLHFTLDYPDLLPTPLDTIIADGAGSQLTAPPLTP